MDLKEIKPGVSRVFHLTTENRKHFKEATCGHVVDLFILDKEVVWDDELNAIVWPMLSHEGRLVIV